MTVNARRKTCEINFFSRLVLSWRLCAALASAAAEALRAESLREISRWTGDGGKNRRIENAEKRRCGTSSVGAMAWQSPEFAQSIPSYDLKSRRIRIETNSSIPAIERCDFCEIFGGFTMRQFCLNLRRSEEFQPHDFAPTTVRPVYPVS